MHTRGCRIMMFLMFMFARWHFNPPLWRPHSNKFYYQKQKTRCRRRRVVQLIFVWKRRPLLLTKAVGTLWGDKNLMIIWYSNAHPQQKGVNKIRRMFSTHKINSAKKNPDAGRKCENLNESKLIIHGVFCGEF